MLPTPRAHANNLMVPGLRIGLTDDPDALFLGGMLQFDNLAGVPNLQLEIGGDIGIPDADFIDFLLRFPVHLKYMFPVGRGDMAVYPLVGFSLYYVDFDGRFGNDDSDTDVELDVGVGFTFNRFAIELWLPDPDITLSFSIVFM
jgi:hypothetical protein